jgi:hypothetical protein
MAHRRKKAAGKYPKRVEPKGRRRPYFSGSPTVVIRHLSGPVMPFPACPALSVTQPDIPENFLSRLEVLIRNVERSDEVRMLSVGMCDCKRNPRP